MFKKYFLNVSTTSLSSEIDFSTSEKILASLQAFFYSTSIILLCEFIFPEKSFNVGNVTYCKITETGPFLYQIYTIIMLFTKGHFVGVSLQIYFLNESFSVFYYLWIWLDFAWHIFYRSMKYVFPSVFKWSTWHSCMKA